MYTDASLSRYWVKRTHAAALTAAVCATLALPTQARAAGVDCTPVHAAVTFQSRKPFHALVSSTPTRQGSIPATTTQAIWVGGTLYTQMADRWLPSPMPPENALSGVTGGVTHFSDCRRLADDAIHGEATTVYAAKMESGQAVQLWISTKTGLLLRDVVDQDIMKVTVDFDYANVQAPPVSR